MGKSTSGRVEAKAVTEQKYFTMTNWRVPLWPTHDTEAEAIIA